MRGGRRPIRSPPEHNTRPSIFLLHINDLPDMVHPGTRCRLFADDCLLYHVVDSINDQLQLQQDLKKLEDWADTWGMGFNAAKCHMTIDRGKSTLTHVYQLCNTFLSKVDAEK